MNIQPITGLPTGAGSRIARITGNHHFLSRASAMGFTVGVQVLMVQNYRQLPLLVYLRDTQVAIDRREAENIHVEV